MTKERVNISIDSELLKKAKKHNEGYLKVLKEQIRNYK